MTGLHDLTGLKDKFDAYKGHYDWIKGSQRGTVMGLQNLTGSKHQFDAYTG